MNYKQIIQQYGSPVYLYDLDKVSIAKTSLANSLPGGSILFYSIKANPHPCIVRFLYDLNCNVELSSIGELRTALGEGVIPERCLFTGPGKTVTDIEEALASGLTLFSVESLAELRLIERLAGERALQVKVLLRVNADIPPNNIGLAMMGVHSQFGIDYSELLSQQGLAGSLSPAISITGFHFYMASNIQAVTDLLRCFSASLESAITLSRHLGIVPELINLGGGFGHPYANNESLPVLPGLKEGLEQLIAGYINQSGNRPRFAFESGRYLAGGCGKLITAVQDVKVSKETHYVITDSGINHLGGMAGLRRIPNYTPDIEVMNKNNNPVLNETMVCGPLCTPLDILARKQPLPGLERGDLMIISNVGAYGLTGSLIGFLSHPAPAEIIIKDEVVVSASRLEINRKKIS